MHAEFQAQISHDGDTDAISVRGELDLTAGPELEAALAEVSTATTRRVLIDLRELEFMDSTGLSIIVRAHQRLAEDGVELCLVKGTPQVQRLLDLTGVTERLRLLAGPEELLNER